MKIYTIEKGKHRSGYFLAPYLGEKEIEFDACFGRGCWNERRDHNDYDINKLFGISFGYHHHNSFRIGWVPDFSFPGRFLIYVYYYNEGNRYSSFIGSVNAGDLFKVKLYILPSRIVLDFKSKYFGVSIFHYSYPFKFPLIKIGYYLFPYFGGDNTAPCDMRIFIDKH